MGENKREYMPVRRYTFPAGVCGGDDVWRSTGMQYWPDYVDWQK